MMKDAIHLTLQMLRKVFDKQIERKNVINWSVKKIEAFVALRVDRSLNLRRHLSALFGMKNEYAIAHLEGCFATRNAKKTMINVCKLQSKWSRATQLKDAMVVYHALVAMTSQSPLSPVSLCGGDRGQRHSESWRTEAQHGEEIQYTCLRS